MLKAARALADGYNVPANAHIELEKNLPVASGMGGGSADAAATLRALVHLWGLTLSDQNIQNVAHQIGHDLETRKALDILFSSWRDDLDCERMTKLALGLGADVPVCLESRTVYMAGIGEQLSLAPALPKVWVVLANPLTNVSTPAVFKARTGDFSAPAPFAHAPKDAHELVFELKQRRNDLSPPARTLAPDIDVVINALEHQNDCLLARMSGSGATCFALFSKQNAAIAAQFNLNQSHADWWVQTAQLTDGLPIEKWL
ncbi:MAG: hypothetical protein JKX85_08485 [Phycisphaeraceae bacterium]|nr:hypothetical protein [Phycisphaeraceae bacterium]